MKHQKPRFKRKPHIKYADALSWLAIHGMETLPNETDFNTAMTGISVALCYIYQVPEMQVIEDLNMARKIYAQERDRDNGT
jgi:hypothetical protein